MEHTNVFQRHLMPLSVDLASVGKWILTGEHAVLRGVPALVFPLTSRRLFIKGELHLLPGEDTALEQCQLEFGGEFGRDLQPLFYEIFKKALDLIPKGPKFVVKGHLKIISELPLGAGLGTSASLSVALGRIFWNLGLVKEEELFSWATSLEHFFHGESSGVDVAAVLHQAPLLYSRYGGLKVCRFSYFPPISLHYVGTKGYTRDCVAKVKELYEQFPKKGQQLDQAMGESVSLALQGFEEANLEKLRSAIQLARRVFEEWGLVDAAMAKTMAELEAKGALATKPTGSGLGGYVLALWDPSIDRSQIENAIVAL